MMKSIAVSLLLMTLMLATQFNVHMQEATATPSSATQRAAAQATLEVLQTQIANIEATITALDEESESIDSQEEWRLLEGDGVSLRAPISWDTLDMSMDMLLDQVDQVESSTFDFEMLAQMSSMLGDAMVLFAVNYDYSTFAFATTVNIVAVDLGFVLPLNFIVEANVQQMSSQVQNIDGEVIDLNSEEVGRIYAALDVNGINIREVQYYFIRETTLYIISFGTTKNQFEELEDEFYQIAGTFTVVD